jgi:hypothetical protein
MGKCLWKQKTGKDNIKIYIREMSCEKAESTGTPQDWVNDNTVLVVL